MATLTCQQFTQLLVDEQPRYDKRILSDITPLDGWIGHYATGVFPAFSGTSLYQDRFNAVYPNTTKAWANVTYASCVGAPCNDTFNCIGWGSERLQYSLEKQSWQTPPLCFDQELHVTHAREQFRQIISDILKPATSAIASMFLRKRALFWSSRKWLASAQFGQEGAGEFAYIWQNDADGNEVFLLTTAVPTSKLTPQMLANRVNPLLGVGYMSASPFKDGELPPFIELVSGLETIWELDHLGGGAGSGGASGTGVANNWRFDQWSAANKYWRYGFTGSIGNYATRVDPFEMRFNLVGASGNPTYPFKFQLVLPYTNIVSSGAGGAAGLKRVWNQGFSNACYSMSYISHKQALEVLTQEMAKINPEMPFVTQNYGGKWRAVLPNVCVQDDGTIGPLDNRLGNIIQFLARFQLAIRPGRTEFLESIFHQRGPQCIVIQPTCQPCEHPTQDYNSCNAVCADAVGGVVGGVVASLITTLIVSLLLQAGTYGVLGATPSVTNTGASVVNGDLGVWPAASIVGFPPGIVTGTQNAGNAAAQAAQTALTASYLQLAGMASTATVAGDIGGQTLAPGVYTSAAALDVSSADLVLDGGGDAAATWVFQVGSALNVANGRQIVLINGANARNIFWQVGSSATLGTIVVFNGSILALTSITVNTGSTVNGRLLARNGTVTLDSDAVTVPV